MDALEDELDESDVDFVVSLQLLAGGMGEEGHADGGADEARLLEPRGLAVDVRRQRVYVAELHAIRAVDLCSGAVETLAGAEDEGDADGPGDAARFNNLRGIAMSDDGRRLCVCDFWNHCVREITFAPLAGGSRRRRERRRVDPALVRACVGGVHTWHSPGGLSTPNDVAFDSAGTLFIACGSGFDDDTIRSMSSTGDLALEAGVLGSAGDADGPCKSATFDSPQGIAVDERGSLYVADYCNHVIRKVNLAQDRVVTIAGCAGEAGDCDGDGVDSRFTEPSCICLSSAPLAGSGERTIYVAEGTGRVRWLRRVWCCSLADESASDYLVGTIVGTPDLWAPRGIAVVPGSGDLLVSDAGKSVVWQLGLRSGLRSRLLLARKRLLFSMAVLLRQSGAADRQSPASLLSTDVLSASTPRPIDPVCLLCGSVC